MKGIGIGLSQGDTYSVGIKGEGKLGRGGATGWKMAIKMACVLQF